MLTQLGCDGGCSGVPTSAHRHQGLNSQVQRQTKNLLGRVCREMFLVCDLRVWISFFTKNKVTVQSAAFLIQMPHITTRLGWVRGTFQI